ncbi:hypothetical protein ACIQGT_36485 [Streptomyces sp. NPDC093108]|uniref:hypothetical protein n=1 Tax=Streptomyces sp. NPDC093108 TaxID=3366030 RepID=UPI0038234858
MGDFEVKLLSHDGTDIATARAPRELPDAVHASGPWCAIGTTNSVSIAAATDDEITMHGFSHG